MKNRKRFMAILLTAVMVLSTLTACGSKAKKTSDTSSTSGTTPAATSGAAATGTADAQSAGSQVTWDSSKKDTVTVSVINNYYTAGEKKLAEEYMKLHPETKVVIDVISDNDAYVTKMQTSFSGDKKNAPDIVHGNFAAGVVGGFTVGVQKGYFYDMNQILDETNPYNDGKKVREAFDDADIALALNNSGGVNLGWLPFDKCGVAFYYNKTIFDKLGLTAPTTFEGLINTCEKLKAAGYKTPVSAGGESEWLINFLSDACYRSIEGQFLVQPGDANYDEKTMSLDKDFKFDENDLKCDTYVVDNGERQAKYQSENGVNTDTNKKIWTQFQNIAKYFTQNWIAADSTQVITDFESQVTPILFNGSWNAGLILSDIKQLPSDKQFDWATFQLQSFENAPEGFNQKIRGLYVLGNCMSIIQKDDKDHMERVKDFYKFWYSPAQAKTCYEETLSNGNFVQGPCVVKGVELSEDLTAKLQGFIATGNARTFSWASGQTCVLQADKPVYNDLISKLSEGSIDAASFLKQLDPLYKKYVDDNIKKAGYDLDPTTKDTAK